MSESFHIAIPNEKAATYSVITFIIMLINLLAFGYAIFFGHSETLNAVIVIGFCISLFSFILIFVKQYKHYSLQFSIEMSFIISALCWFFSGNYLLGILLFVFGVMGFITNKKAVIHFDKKGILYPSFPEKLFLWASVDFVILKDGILTIELKDNKLLQFTLEKQVASQVDEMAFNSFIKRMKAQ